MQIIIDNIMQTWWKFNCPPIISFLMGTVILSLIILVLFGLYTYINRSASDFWLSNQTTTPHEIRWKWGSLKDKLFNNPFCPDNFSVKFGQNYHWTIAFGGLLSAWTACLFLPWSASHCNLPSQVTLSGFSNQADILCFFGFVFVSYWPSFALIFKKDKYWHLQDILFKKLSWLCVFGGICLGPITLTGSLSISEIVKKQSEGMFGFSWLGLYCIPSFLGTAAAIIFFYNWQRICDNQNNSNATAQTDAAILCSPLSRFFINLTDRFNFFSLICLFLLLFGGGWNLPTIIYPAYINLGFLIVPDIDLICGFLVFTLKFTVLSILWPYLYRYLSQKKTDLFSIPVSLTLVTFNLLICFIGAGFSAVYLGG